MFALPTFPGRPGIVLPSKSVLCTLLGRKKPRPYGRGLVFALPIFQGSRPPSIVGVHLLNFCVLDGNSWTHMTINTNYVDALTSSFRICGDPYRIRTDVNGVRGRCLNHLTNGPFGVPSGTRTRDPLIKSQLLYQLS